MTGTAAAWGCAACGQVFDSSEARERHRASVHPPNGPAAARAQQPRDPYVDPGEDHIKLRPGSTSPHYGDEADEEPLWQVASAQLAAAPVRPTERASEAGRRSTASYGPRKPPGWIRATFWTLFRLRSLAKLSLVVAPFAIALGLIEGWSTPIGFCSRGNTWCTSGSSSGGPDTILTGGNLVLLASGAIVIAWIVLRVTARAIARLSWVWRVEIV